jgi:hypothetical protein
MKAREARWVSLAPSLHFVATEDRARRCVMCHKLIAAGERQYASHDITYRTAGRFHEDCAQKYANIIYAEKNP